MITSIVIIAICAIILIGVGICGIIYTYKSIRRKRKDLDSQLIVAAMAFIQRYGKSATKGFVSNKSETIMIREFTGGEIRTQMTTWMDKPCVKIFRTNNMDHAIILPVENWRSFVVFLSESFALAESEAAGKKENITIHLFIDRK